MEKSIFSADYDTFCRLLRQVRIEAGLSQYKLAARLHTTQSWISKCERGERRLDVVELRKFCLAMDITADKFMQRLDTAIRQNENAPHDLS